MLVKGVSPVEDEVTKIAPGEWRGGVVRRHLAGEWST